MRLADWFTDASTAYLIIQSDLEQLPGAVIETSKEDGSVAAQCIYTPHSLRATAATLLLDAGVDIRKVQDLLGHRPIGAQIYDKRRRSTAESASHDVPI